MRRDLSISALKNFNVPEVFNELFTLPESPALPQKINWQTNRNVFLLMRRFERENLIELQQEIPYAVEIVPKSSLRMKKSLELFLIMVERETKRN
jgi:GTPase Era involved in 16S rRNA processing